MYKITNLHGYPDDGNHQIVVFDQFIPYNIFKGMDGFLEEDKWYIRHAVKQTKWDVQDITYFIRDLYQFEHPFDNVEDAIKEAVRAWKSWLEVSLNKTHEYLLRLHNL